MNLTSPPSRSGRSTIARARRLARGFTLIELTVSLVAGLIVAMAVAMLSREATASFHEEVRVSAAEAGLRSAVDRLRADLQRASFMSTPNVQMEPRIGKAYDRPNVDATVAAATPGLAQIQGIRLYAGSAAINTTNDLSLDTVNNLTPAKLDITGNMTTADQFEVQSAVTVGTCCQINLAASSPAIFRVLNANDAGVIDSNADSEMKAVFQPVSNVTNQFVVRYVDAETNHSQFLLTCAGKQAAGILPGPPIQPYVLTTTCPLTGAQTKTVTGSNGNNGGLAWVNPVSTVRWQIVGPASAAPDRVPPQQVAALDNQAMGGGQDSKKYDLIRSLLDGATGNVIDETTEVVAEYAVDLDFAFAVDVSGDLTGATPVIKTYDFGDVTNQMVAALGKSGVTSGPPSNANPEPQRIRSVRFRVATRAALADRTANIAAPSMGDAGAGTFLFRYCLNPAGCSGTTTLQWARVRTLVSEVSLPNQQQAFF